MTVQVVEYIPVVVRGAEYTLVAVPVSVPVVVASSPASGKLGLYTDHTASSFSAVVVNNNRD